MHAPLAYHWARMIEMLHAAETIHGLLQDDDLGGSDLIRSGERNVEGVGVIEAPAAPAAPAARLSYFPLLVAGECLLQSMRLPAKRGSLASQRRAPDSVDRGGMRGYPAPQNKLGAWRLRKAALRMEGNDLAMNFKRNSKAQRRSRDLPENKSATGPRDQPARCKR